MKGLCLLTAFIGGVAAGAAVGMLFAPAKGSETRANIYDFMSKHGIKLSKSDLEELKQCVTHECGCGSESKTT